MIPIHDDTSATSKPLVTVTFMIVCVLVFLWQLSLGSAGQSIIYSLGLIPAVLFGRTELPSQLDLIAPPWTISSMARLETWWSAAPSTLVRA